MMNTQNPWNKDGRSRANTHRSMIRRSFIGLAIGAGLAIGLAACGDEEPVPEVQQAAQPTDTPTRAAPTVELPPVEPYDPQDDQSIFDRYAVDAERLDTVLVSGYPILLVSDAIW